MKKRMVTLGLALIMMLSLAVPAGAAVVPGDGEISPQLVVNQTSTGDIYVPLNINGVAYSVGCRLRTTAQMHDYNFNIISVSNVTKIATLYPGQIANLSVACATHTQTPKTYNGNKATQRVVVTVTHNGKVESHYVDVTTIGGSQTLEYYYVEPV